MERLTNALKAMQIPFNEAQVKKLYAYMQGILEWNEKINLTAIKEEDDFIKKHYIDSFFLYKHIYAEKPNKIIDVGTGGGFPGIPLAIICPDIAFTLMDSLKKRLNVIDTLCKELEIKNVKTLHGRAEDLGRITEYRENFDICVSRAVANLSTLSEYCLPFVKVGGKFIAMKGPELENEIFEGKKAIKILGGSIDGEFNTQDTCFKEYDHRILVVEKNQKTQNFFPRRAGTPSKEPLGKK